VITEYFLRQVFRAKPDRSEHVHDAGCQDWQTLRTEGSR